MGFIESFKKGWTFMKAAFRMAGQDRKLLAPSVYMVLASILYFVGWLVALVKMNPQWSDTTWTIVGGVATLGSFIITYFFCGMTVNMIDVHLKGGKPSLGEGARDAGKNIVAIIFLAIISTIIEMFAKFARRNNSIVGKIIAGIVESIWTVVSFLLLPAIIIEDASFGTAMRRVRDLHKRNLVLIGIGEVGVRMVTFLIGLLWMVVIMGIVWVGVKVDGTPGLVIIFLGGGTMLTLFSAFNIYLRMAYYTCLYLWAVEVEKAGGRQVKAPGPLGAALGHDVGYPVGQAL